MCGSLLQVTPRLLRPGLQMATDSQERTSSGIMPRSCLLKPVTDQVVPAPPSPAPAPDGSNGLFSSRPQDVRQGGCLLMDGGARGNQKCSSSVIARPELKAPPPAQSRRWALAWLWSGVSIQGKPLGGVQWSAPLPCPLGPRRPAAGMQSHPGGCVRRGV